MVDCYDILYQHEKKVNCLFFYVWVRKMDTFIQQRSCQDSVESFDGFFLFFCSTERRGVDID